jgi:hypothetical protein
MQKWNKTAHISVMMVASLTTFTKEEQRSVICFLGSEEVKLTEIRRQIKVQYGDACLSLKQVYEWTTNFRNGIISVTISPRPGQVHRILTPEAIAAGEDIVKENRHVIVNEIAAHLDISHGSAHHIVHDVLHFHKMCVARLPRHQTAEFKERRFDA